LLSRSVLLSGEPNLFAAVRAVKPTRRFGDFKSQSVLKISSP
jgi:hypothetical protein